ncbi:molybdopterin-dependent oxidoreductase [Paracoccus jeotgali]|uniref:molybdopterin-dependent oxidoreductase n=1 Tax=Paracoccus jeotgali TaxID=2065379 RepID=UPI0028A5D850|nr:molybdopterin-dependent oxidoreductase [Paracoccus jeotgali]
MTVKSCVFPALTALLALTVPAHADQPILTLTGKVAGGHVAISRAQLKGLGWHELVTSTSVTDGPQRFRGVLMRDLLELAGAQGDSVRATALNDYVIDIPASDFDRFDVLAALYMNGEALGPRDKGPIWIVYPRDDFPELQDIRYDMRWVWQLVGLEVR